MGRYSTLDSLMISLSCLNLSNAITDGSFDKYCIITLCEAVMNNF